MLSFFLRVQKSPLCIRELLIPLVLIFKYIVKLNVAFVSGFCHLAALDRTYNSASLFLDVGSLCVLALTDPIVYLGKAEGEIFKVKEVESVEIKH